MARGIRDGLAHLPRKHLDGTRPLAEEIQDLESRPAAQRLPNPRDLLVDRVLKYASFHPAESPIINYSIKDLNTL